jgi:hypothetical protein
MEPRLTLLQHLGDDTPFNFIEPLCQHQHCDTLTLDFSKLEYALPLGTILLAIVIRDFTSREVHRTIKVKQVDNSEKHSYLSHVGLKSLESFVFLTLVRRRSIGSLMRAG